MERESSFQGSQENKKKFEVSLELSYLSEKDAKTIVSSAEKVTNNFLSDFPNELPDAIIFPEAAARPLVYLFLPLLKKLATKREVPLPKIFFFRVNKDVAHYRLQDTSSKLETDRMRLIPELEETITAIEEGTHPDQSAITLDEQESLKDLLEKAQLDMEAVKDLDVLNIQRAEEIQKYINKLSPKLVIIDDYISDIPVTVNLVREAFKDLSIKAYSLLSVADRELAEKKHNYKAGMTDPFIKEGDIASPGFAYRTEKVGLGVVKTPRSNDVKADSENRNYQIALRKDLMEIGKILSDLDDWKNRTTRV